MMGRQHRREGHDLSTTSEGWLVDGVERVPERGEIMNPVGRERDRERHRERQTERETDREKERYPASGYRNRASLVPDTSVWVPWADCLLAQ